MCTELRPEHVKGFKDQIGLDYQMLLEKKYERSDLQLILRDVDFCWTEVGNIKPREFLILGLVYCRSTPAEKRKFLWYLVNPQISETVARDDVEKLMKDLLWVAISQRTRIVNYKQEIDEEKQQRVEVMKKYLTDCELR